MCADPACSEPVHHEFGLTYASYLVLQRSVLQDMPEDWQRRLCALMAELHQRVDMAKVPSQFKVLAVNERGKFMADPFREYRRPSPIPLRSAVDTERSAAIGS